MTGREKFAAAFSAGGTREFPAAICYMGIMQRDHWEELTNEPWWTQHDPAPERRAQAARDMVQRTGADWFPVSAGPSRAERENVAIETGSEGVFRVDRRTGERRRLTRPPVSGAAVTARSVTATPRCEGATDPEQIDAAIEACHGPSEETAEKLDREGRLDLPRLLVRELGRDRWAVGAILAPFWWCTSLWGYDGLFTALADTPDLVEHACRRHQEALLRRIGWLQAMGADTVWIEDCMTDMISPAQYRRLNLPYLQELGEAIRAAGMRSIYYYCGNPHTRWDLLLDCGADALALEESKKGFATDIEDIVRRVQGRMVVFGNLDAISLLERGSDADLRREIERQCRAGLANHGRFVMSLGSPVTPGTTIDRVRRYCDLVHEFRE